MGNRLPQLRHLKSFSSAPARRTDLNGRQVLLLRRRRLVDEAQPVGVPRVTGVQDVEHVSFAAADLQTQRQSLNASSGRKALTETTIDPHADPLVYMQTLWSTCRPSGPHADPFRIQTMPRVSDLSSSSTGSFFSPANGPNFSPFRAETRRQNRQRYQRFTQNHGNRERNNWSYVAHDVTAAPGPRLPARARGPGAADTHLRDTRSRNTTTQQHNNTTTHLLHPPRRVQTDSILDLRRLQGESVRHVHAQHGHPAGGSGPGTSRGARDVSRAARRLFGRLGGSSGGSAALPVKRRRAQLALLRLQEDSGAL
ncbi:hypothetical protein EYF80_056865 [Liparis tanakae]|uniref:Uncharacterized protein n=1 Tax=Liparis tanakae TaxID=230148 RepID=A0A4Z2EW04_9TELE|nr:hypothetical protein EYF80_056865 [Liparis tanakae]